MTDETAGTSRAETVKQHLPYLRRYARALTGSQQSGDAYAAATLEAILSDEQTLDKSFGDKAALFKVFHALWSSTGSDFNGEGDSPAQSRAIAHLRSIRGETREALLLSAIEDFTAGEVAFIIGIDREQAGDLIAKAFKEMEDAAAGRILIIEDEAVIALDLEGLVSELGHKVVGVARTREAAVTMGQRLRPDLILADIELADRSSGIDAVNELFATIGRTPVIFITSFPERLLTGERPEPAFLINKPYDDIQVRTAVSQAMFFASAEMIEA